MEKISLAWTIGPLASYLLGSVPFGLLLSLAAGVDVRKCGSGNIGATNVYRSVSKKLGLLTFLCDFLKGLAGSLLMPWLFAEARPEFALACGVAAVFGHTWPVFLKFKGGKGVATSAGMLAGCAGWAMLIAFGVWWIVLLTLRYMSVASCAAAVALGVAVWPLYFAKSGWLVPTVLTVLALLVVWKHRGNIKRLAAGTEPHFTFRKP